MTHSVEFLDRLMECRVDLPLLFQLTCYGTPEEKHLRHRYLLIVDNRNAKKQRVIILPPEDIKTIRKILEDWHYLDGVYHK